jgi:hypothetical protein
MSATHPPTLPAAVPDAPVLPDVAELRGAAVRWAEPALAFLHRRPVTQLLLTSVFLVAGTMVDAALMRPAIMRVLGDTDAWSTAVAFTLAGVGAVAAAMAGWTWRGAVGNEPGRRAALILPGTILTGWAALGLGITWLRVGAAAALVEVQYDGAAAGASQDASETIAAAVFLVVYLVVGVLAFGDAYAWRNDAFSAKTRAERELATAREELRSQEALFERLRANLAIRAHDLTSNPDALAQVLASHRALARELAQVSRVEQAIGLGDPTATGITSTQHRANPQAHGGPASDR